MAFDKETFVYGVTDCKVYPLTTESGTQPPAYGTAVDVPGIQEIGISYNLESKELQGDDVVLDRRTSIKSISLDVTHAKISLDALPVILGGTTSTSGTTPNRVYTYRQDDVSPPYFKLAAQVTQVDEDHADLHFVAYKCKVTDFSLGATGEDYKTVSFTAEAIPCVNSSYFYDLVEHETATNL